MLSTNFCLLFYQAVSIADKEVFDFRMVNYTDATEGDAYLDMSQVNMGVSLTVGCIQLIYLNKFVSSIMVRGWSCGRRLYIMRRKSPEILCASLKKCTFPCFLLLRRRSSTTSRRPRRLWLR